MVRLRKRRCLRRSATIVDIYVGMLLPEKKQASLEAVTEYLELSAPTVADELNRRREKNRRRHINPAIIGKNRKKKTNAAATGSVRAQNLRPSWAKLDVACAHEEKRQLRNSRAQAAEKSVASHGARQRIACRKKRGSLRFLSSLMCRNWAPPASSPRSCAATGRLRLLSSLMFRD